MSENYKNVDIYGGQDPRHIPFYGTTLAARYLKLPSATLRSWAIGRPYKVQDKLKYFKPLVELPKKPGNQLSFSNLIEIHILRALRTDHGVPIRSVRSALLYAQDKLKIPRLLLSPELKADGKDLFLDKYFELINLSRSGQLAIKNMLESYLKRIEWDSDNLPAKLYPFISDNPAVSSREIVINPFISFGKPIIDKRGITTAIIANRYDEGDSIQELAADYDLDDADIETAIFYERAA